MRRLLYIGVLAIVVGLAVGLLSGKVFAYVVCNSNGDCWRTPKKIKAPGTKLIYHSEDWWKKNQGDRRYKWHEADGNRSWKRGYWSHGQWRPL